jgi:hypothetical protein
MPDYHVGLNLRERFENPPTVAGVPVSIGGQVVRTKKGDVRKAIFVTSWEEFERKCGGFYGGYAGPKHVRGFFVNEGVALWISRVLRPEVFASYNTGSVGSNNAIDWDARHPGADANNIRVELKDPAAPGQSLSITVNKTVTGWDIIVSLATDGGSAIISTAAQVIAAVNAHLTSLQLLVASNTSGSSGAGVVAAVAIAPLTGGSGPSTSDGWFNDGDQLGHSIKIAARNPGNWGNSLECTTGKAQTTAAVAVTGGANTEVEVASVRDFEVGDVVFINDGTNLDYFVVHEVDATNKKLKFVSKVLNAFAIGTPVLTATRHAVSTTITTALLNGANQITLNNGIGARVGSLIHINDGTTEITVLVTSVSGNTIYFAPITLGAPIAANSPATSFEFNLEVADEVGAFEPLQQLSMEPTNTLNYVNNRLSGKANESELVEVLDQNPSNTPAYLNLPYPVWNIALMFGLDGETPQDSDYIGVSTAGQETGIYRFKGIKEISAIATPGVTSQLVIENGVDWCDAELHAMYIFAPPQSIDTVEEAIEWRDYTVNFSSMRGACYFPYLTIYDPDTDYTQLKDISPEGWVMGVWSRVAADRGTHKAPANERINGIAGLATDESTIDWDDASLLLNPRGINIIRDFPGYGIRVFGGRTTLKEGRPQQFVHVMRTTIFVEQSMLNDALWIAFEPNNEDLSEDVFDMMHNFLYNLWKDGVFVPEANPDQAFYVYTGSGINPQAQRDAGIFKAKFGFNVVGTAEKVVFIVTNMRGNRSIEEQ